MNRKLHNSLSALMAAGASLAIALMIAVPAQPLPQQQVRTPTPISLQVGALDIEVTPAVTREQAAASAEALVHRIAQGEVETLAEAAALTAEIATAAALAGAFEASQDMDDRPSEPHQVHQARRHSRQTFVMPYFSFSRG